MFSTSVYPLISVIHHSKSVQLPLVICLMPSTFHYLCGSSVVITYPSTPVQLSLVIYISILLYLCPYSCCHLPDHLQSILLLLCVVPSVTYPTNSAQVVSCHHSEPL